MPKGAPGSRGGPILPRRLGSKGGEGEKSHEGPKILVVLIPWGLESKTVIERSNERCSALFWQLGAWTLPSEGADGWLMRGITIPQYEFALKKRGGDVFAGHYLHDLYTRSWIAQRMQMHNSIWANNLSWPEVVTILHRKKKRYSERIGTSYSGMPRTTILPDLAGSVKMNKSSNKLSSDQYHNNIWATWITGKMSPNENLWQRHNNMQGTWPQE